ncbi:hypothetical protein L7F22_016852 [Adiantum nelumboides]|nr:hypothetical protein [Adiantum nelumboides]
MYMQQVLSIAEGISKELDQQQEQLAKVEVQLQQKRDVSLRNEGLSSAYSGLYTELEELKKELEHLKNSPDATPRDIDCKELEVQAITKVLTKVGASLESLNMKQDLDALQEKRDALEEEAKLLIAQQAFMDKATKFIQREGRASMVPTPPATASTLKPIAFVGGSCAACGKPLSANHMAGVFLLTCQHKYHPFCFAVLCATSTGCSHPNCKEKIPEIAKCWALGTAYTELGETKDGSCCLDSYDEDHSDRSDSFQMKGTASDDIANVLQGMAKVTTENSPILVLEEPSGKMDNASTLVEDKDKNSTVDPPINFSIDVPPVHEGKDHEKNTTLDLVSKVSIDSAEGDHGKDKIVDPASKLSADNPEGMQGLGNYSTLLLDDNSYKNHLNEKGTYVVLPDIEQQPEEQWDGFLRNDVLQFLYTWVDAKEEDRFKIGKECNFDVSESAEQRLDMLFIKKNLEGGGTIYPSRNSGLHENPKPKNPGSAAGDPGSASGSPRKHGHPRPQYKRPGTQWHK